MTDLFTTFPVLIAAVITASEYIDKIWDLDGLAAWIRSAVIGLLLTFVGAYFQLGLFADCTLFEFWCGLTWYYQGLIASVIVIGASNGLFAFEKVKNILVLIKARK